MMPYFTLNHGYNWCCYYYELVLFPKQKQKISGGRCVWLSLTFLVQDKEQNADKERYGREKKKITKKTKKQNKKLYKNLQPNFPIQGKDAFQTSQSSAEV